MGEYFRIRNLTFQGRVGGTWSRLLTVDTWVQKRKLLPPGRFENFRTERPTYWQHRFHVVERGAVTCSDTQRVGTRRRPDVNRGWPSNIGL